MRALIIGSGAREHALAWKICQSSLLEKLYLYGANDGFSHLGQVIEAKDFEELAKIAKNEKIDIVIMGPETPLVQGVVDIFKSEDIACIGADKYWAQLEGSKVFAKKFMQKHSIKTAKYEIIKDENNLPKIAYPLVLKADGLCGGKGVCVVQNSIEAKAKIEEYLNGKFGEASKTIVAEEFLEGQEISLICLFDGETLLPFVPARDFKKLENGDKGPNTGGMGAFCPVALTEKQNQKMVVLQKQLQEALLKEKADFMGVIYAGLIWTKGDFYVLEFNMRFGDPETQALMMHLDCDILEIFDLCSKKQLKKVNLIWKEGFSGCLTIATKGYPDEFPRNIPIENISDEVQVFYAGVKNNNGLKSNGGRVLSLCNTEKNPYAKIYSVANSLEFKEKYFRTDIDIC